APAATRPPRKNFSRENAVNLRYLARSLHGVRVLTCERTHEKTRGVSAGFGSLEQLARRLHPCQRASCARSPGKTHTGSRGFPSELAWHDSRRVAVHEHGPARRRGLRGFIVLTRQLGVELPANRSRGLFPRPPHLRRFGA